MTSEEHVALTEFLHANRGYKFDYQAERMAGAIARTHGVDPEWLVSMARWVSNTAKCPAVPATPTLPAGPLPWWRRALCWLDAVLARPY